MKDSSEASILLRSWSRARTREELECEFLNEANAPRMSLKTRSTFALNRLYSFDFAHAFLTDSSIRTSSR